MGGGATYSTVIWIEGHKYSSGRTVGKAHILEKLDIGSVVCGKWTHTARLRIEFEHLPSQLVVCYEGQTQKRSSRMLVGDPKQRKFGATLQYHCTEQASI